MEGKSPNDRTAWAISSAGLALLLVGWTAILRSEHVADSSGRLARQQVVWTMLGLAVMLAASRIDYRRWLRHSFIAYGGTVLALAAVYLFPAVNGAHRWIRAGGIGIQPSEFAKLAFIVVLARHLMYRDIGVSFVHGALWPLALATLPMMLILKEPDLGTSLVFLPVLFAMLFAAGARRRDVVRLLVAGIMLLPLLWSQMSREQQSRVTALWEQNGPLESPTADGFHLDQAKRMFALGGVWGTFFTDGSGEPAQVPLPYRVPEPHTDSVYCVLGERFGLAGAGLVLLLFVLLIAGCLRVAERAEEPCGRLIAVGMAALFGAEVLINTGMIVGLLPITGLSLPLVSYGGSNLIAHLLGLGLVINVARNAN